jgi:hypothetical protein
LKLSGQQIQTLIAETVGALQSWPDSWCSHADASSIERKKIDKDGGQPIPVVFSNGIASRSTSILEALILLAMTELTIDFHLHLSLFVAFQRYAVKMGLSCSRDL